MTSIGVAVFLSPLVGGVTIALGLAMLLLRRYASLASITVAVVMPLLFAAGALWFHLPPAYALATLAISLAVVFQLRPNILRLLAGTERKVAFPCKRATSAANKCASGAILRGFE